MSGGRKRKSGCVIFKITAKGNLKILLITTAAGKWVLPKGTIEAGETAQEAALRETYEEAGVRCDIIDTLGTVYQASKDADIEYFVAIATAVHKRKLWEERKQRNRAWLKIPKALARIQKDFVREALRRFHNWCESNAHLIPAEPTSIEVMGGKVKKTTTATAAPAPAPATTAATTTTTTTTTTTDLAPSDDNDNDAADDGDHAGAASASSSSSRSSFP